ncbi:hypothetical protein EYF80_022536 [Liparis tanakae]|uniref:Uncharacterized protein n=1 Tax=Liparis tanakae TaxID=230148 RepID=A0A4Z2HNF0_9TELE|nr:hypothetical protein EYF80_022536 [Liparis tanakae]
MQCCEPEESQYLVSCGSSMTKLEYSSCSGPSYTDLLPQASAGKDENSSRLNNQLAPYPSLSMIGVSILLWSHLPEVEIRSRNCECELGTPTQAGQRVDIQTAGCKAAADEQEVLQDTSP